MQRDAETSMDRTVKDHITFLEGRLRELHTTLMNNDRTLPERNRLESEIRAAQTALTFYRKALELEHQIGD